MIRHFVNILVFMVAIVGCDARPVVTVSEEQAVYESLFLKLMGNTHQPYYLVQETESEWFKSNPFVVKDWERFLENLGGIEIGLVKSLYKGNEVSGSIDWVPLLTNAKILSKEYNVPARKANDNLCLVPLEDGNITIRSQEGKGFRAYFTVSNVAFSKDKKTALVKYSYLCAPLSGGGEFFVVFRFVENQWILVGGKTLWIS